MVTPRLSQTVTLTCSHRELSFEWSNPLVYLKENELTSVITQLVPLESTHRELSFEWSHLKFIITVSALRRFLGVVKFAFDSERTNES